MLGKVNLVTLSKDIQLIGNKKKVFTSKESYLAN